MTTQIGRRRLFIATLEISTALAALILGFALFAFGSYVASIHTTLDRTLESLRTALPGTAGAHDAELAAIMAATHYLTPDVFLIFTDPTRRITVYRASTPDSPPVITVRSRDDLPPRFRGVGPFARPILAIAGAFGLTTQHARIGTVDVFVRRNDETLSVTAGKFVPAVFLGLVLAVFVGYAIARVLTQQMLRPLVEVTAALERFAAGDLTPQPIDADSRQEFGTLAVAYNAAIVQMERAFAEREHANAAMRQFIADAGHQLRTPLTVIRGFLGILRKGELRTPADRERIIETMSNQSQLMGSLIDKLMLLEHWESESVSGVEGARPIDIGQLVGDVIAPIAEAHPERTVRVETTLGRLVAIDPGDLTHALTNLLDNALKYTAGAIDVRVAYRDGSAVIEVCDEGPGMAPEIAEHVFDRFYRGMRRDVVGSGLGLSIAKRAIERAGGTLVLASDRSGGSRFTIVLPGVATSERRVPA